MLYDCSTAPCQWLIGFNTLSVMLNAGRLGFAPGMRPGFLLVVAPDISTHPRGTTGLTHSGSRKHDFRPTTAFTINGYMHIYIYQYFGMHQMDLFWTSACFYLPATGLSRALGRGTGKKPACTHTSGTLARRCVLWVFRVARTGK